MIRVPHDGPTQSTRSGEGDVVIMRKLYEDGGGAFVDTGRGLAALGAPETQHALATAQERWQLDTTILCMPFLLEEPGTKLEYAGEVEALAGKPPLDDLKVTSRSRTSPRVIPTTRSTCRPSSRSGPPDNLGRAVAKGTSVRVAARRIIDHVRAETARRRREELVVSLVPPEDQLALAAEDEPARHDDTLVLLFPCCHPALSSSSAIALTLRAVGGLTTAEIADRPRCDPGPRS